MKKTINNQQSTIHAGAPAWLPASILKRIELEGRVTFTGSFSAADKKIMRTRRPVKMSSWVEKNIIVTSGPKPGPWQNRTTPYLADIMDAGMFKSVRTIIVCATPQTAKTSLGHNSIAYCIDRAPGDALYVFPDINTAKENIRDRIVPMITASPQLSKYMTGAVDDMANIRVKLQHMAIYAAWASSAARLANKPIRYVIFDEMDKYPEVADRRETDPISLGEKRVQTFRRMGKEKIWKLSTPTIESGPIWQALTKEAQYRFDCWVRCPHCDELQLMLFEQIKWPREGQRSVVSGQKSEVSGQKSEVSGQGAENSPLERGGREKPSLNSPLERGGREADGVCKSKDDHPDPETVTSQKLAWYECPHCGEHWNDDQRDQAVRMSVWKEHETGTELFACLRENRPAKIGFQLPAWISPFVSLSECAASFLKYKKTKKIEALKDFKNAYCAEPWVSYQVERSEDAILALRDDRPRGVVPGGDVVAGLTVAADTQDNGFWYEVRAWGWGLIQESWQIREGFAPSFEALEQIFFEDEYFDEEGKKYIIQGFVIDAMGHRTKEVYQWCSRHKRVFPFKGEQKMNQPITFTPRHKYPGTKILIPGGINLLRANVNHFKDDLSTKLEIALADPGAWHLHSETSRDWAEQLTSEYVDEKTGLWVCPEGKANHAWDVSVYNLVIAEVLGIKFKKKKRRSRRPVREENPQDNKQRNINSRKGAKGY